MVVFFGGGGCFFVVLLKLAVLNNLRGIFGVVLTENCKKINFSVKIGIIEMHSSECKNSHTHTHTHNLLESSRLLIYDV